MLVHLSCERSEYVALHHPNVDTSTSGLALLINKHESLQILSNYAHTSLSSTAIHKQTAKAPSESHLWYYQVWRKIREAKLIQAKGKKLLRFGEQKNRRKFIFVVAGVRHETRRQDNHGVGGKGKSRLIDYWHVDEVIEGMREVDYGRLNLLKWTPRNSITTTALVIGSSFFLSCHQSDVILIREECQENQERRRLEAGKANIPPTFAWCMKSFPRLCSSLLWIIISSAFLLMLAAPFEPSYSCCQVPERSASRVKDFREAFFLLLIFNLMKNARCSIETNKCKSKRRGERSKRFC